MNQIKSLINLEIARQKKLLDQLNVEIDNLPEGRLSISKNKSYLQYIYHLDKTKFGKENKRYLKKSDARLIQSLVQKSYNLKVKSAITKNLENLYSIEKKIKLKDLNEIYNKLPNERKKLVEPIESSFEEFVNRWKAIPYSQMNFQEGTIEIFTKNGERVRSKSEKILADTFADNNIVYKYECPLYINGYGNIYPDFTFISPKTKREIYWEHFGIMGNTDYASNVAKKIDAYQRNNIFIGENLIITFETSNLGLNMETIHKFIKKYLKN